MISPGASRAVHTGSRFDSRLWMLCAGIAVILATLIFCAIQARSDRDDAIASAERETRLLAAALAEQIASDVALANALAGRAAALVGERSWEELGAVDTAAALRGWTEGMSRVDGIWLMDAAATPRIGSGRALAAATLDSYIAVLTRQETEGAVHLGPADEAGADKALHIAVSRRVKAPDGDLRGIVLIIVHPSSLERLVDARRDLPVVVQVAGADNTLLARHALAGASDRAAAGAALSSVSAQVPVPDLPFSVAASISRDDIDAHWQRTALWRSALSFAFLLPALALAAVALSRGRHEAAQRAELQALAEGSEQRILERTATIERLMGEVNHRAKNSLQMISALLRMHAQVAKHADVRTELIEARNRVMTIAHVHDRLYRSDQATRVKLDGLLEEVGDDLLPTLVTMDGAAIDLVVEAVPAELAVDDAVPLILIMNELVASAVKHAFPGGRGGRIWVELALVEGGMAVLSVDNDGTPVSEDEQGGAVDLPMTLIRGLAGQIGGSLSHNVSERGGTRFEVRFSLVREKGRRRA